MMNDNTAHALIQEHNDADLSVTVEDRTTWHGIITTKHGDAVQVSQNNPALTVLEIWTGAGTARIGLREIEARALIALLTAAVD